MNTNAESSLPQEEQESVHDVMNFFSCSKEMADTILQSSKLNGKINYIKKMCHDNATKGRKQ